MEFLLREGGRYCFILARDKDKKHHKKLRRKLVDYCPKQYETGRSEAASLTQKQTKWIEMHQSQVNMCFLSGPVRRLKAQKNPKFLRSLQNGLRDTTNLAITPINAKFAKTIDCLID